MRPRASAFLATFLFLSAALVGERQAMSQSVDCASLQRQIAQTERGGRSGQSTRRLASELARMQAYSHQLECDSFSLFGGNPQCSGINARVEQLRSSLAQLQQGGGEGPRAELVARFDAYCRGGSQPQAQPRGFFESLFGIGGQAPAAATQPAAEAPTAQADDQGTVGARGGGQAVCVRTCDGGFFPLPISARHRAEDLTQMCQALCPGTETAVYTRNPNSEIKTAVGLDGKPYLDLPNALHYQKAYSSACSCLPAGKTWAEALANADQVLDNTRQGDIVVDAQKAAELSRPKSSDGLQLRTSDKSNATGVSAVETRHLPPATAQTSPGSSPGTRPQAAVRQVGPQF